MSDTKKVMVIENGDGQISKGTDYPTYYAAGDEVEFPTAIADELVKRGFVTVFRAKAAS